MVGVLVLIATFFVPWYSVSFSGTDASNNSFTGYINLYSLDGCFGGVAVGSSSSSQNIAQCEYWIQAGASGFLFLIGAVLLVVAMILGVVSGLLGVKASSARGAVVTKSVKRPYKMARNAFIVLFVAVLLFFLVCVLNVEAAEASLCIAGNTASPIAGSCPWSATFSNGYNSDKVTGTISWAPSFGLLAALAGLAMVFAGMMKLRRYFKDLSQWDPNNVPAAQPWPSQPQYQSTPYYPSTAPSRAGPMVNQALGGEQGTAPQCPSCGQYATYIPANASWYCYNCTQLVR